MKYLPNILSILRIVLVPFYLFCIYIVGGLTGIFSAWVIFIVAGITDYLDGFLARKLDCVSDFGKIVDPLADKLIVSVALISLVFKPINLIGIVPVLIILSRELLVTVLRKYYSKKSVVIAANYWGKIKTTAQMTGIIASLLYIILREIEIIPVEYVPSIETGIKIFFWIIVVVTVVSGLSYLINPKIKVERWKGDKVER